MTDTKHLDHEEIPFYAADIDEPDLDVPMPQDADLPAINWRVRIRNRAWWLAMVSALLLLAQAAGSLFGYQWDFVVLDQKIAAVINASFGVLALMGVVNDPTTAGLNDSTQAMGYAEPKVTR
jgi:phi LC3 family holin